MAFAGRLFQDDDAPEPDWHTSKLRTIYKLWFLPTILQSYKRERPATESTETQYTDALNWWETTTRNPDARDIGEEDLKAFVEGLKQATYRRGPNAPYRKLVAATRMKHMTSIGTLLGRLCSSSKKPRLEIFEEEPELPAFKVHHTPKATPDFETFQAIVRKLDSAVGLRLCAPQSVEPVFFWRALLATLYCHGWRLQTALALDWKWFEPGKVNRIFVPSDGNLKTHKAATRPVPDWLLKHWTRQNIRFRTGAWPIPSEGPVFGTTEWLAKTLDRSFRRLQRAAQAHLVTQSRPRLYSLQSLRRLHGDQMDEVGGLMFTSGLVQESLQHSSGSVTAEHYKNGVERAILRLREV